MIPDKEWNDYVEGGVTEKIALTKIDEPTEVYVAFKDKNGNTSIVYQSGYKITYDANLGTGANVVAEQDVKYTSPITITNVKPENNGKYFLGWSTNSSANEAEFKQGETLNPSTINGKEEDVTLFAVWTENVSDLELLADKVEIGDYVNYPVYYKNTTWTSDGVNYTSKLTGWRVIGKDDDGTVRLVSSGAPLRFYHGDDATKSEQALVENFLEIPFGTGYYEYTESGFIINQSLTNIFTNKYTKLIDKKPVVRSMKVEDVLEASGQDNMIHSSNGNMDLINAKYEKLFMIGIPCWLGSRYLESSNSLWDLYISSVGYDYNGSFAVRPVVTLKPTVKTTGRDSKGAWDIEIEDEPHSISFDSNGGNTISDVIQKENGKTYGTLPTPTRSGYNFLGWYTEKEGGNKITSNTTVSVLKD